MLHCQMKDNRNINTVFKKILLEERYDSNNLLKCEQMVRLTANMQAIFGAYEKVNK